MQNATEHLLAALLTLLRPLVRFLLARGIAFDSFVEVAKRAFIKVAEMDFGLPGKRQTDSRISVLTGLTRKEVARVRDEAEPLSVVADQRLNRAVRVVSGWVRDFAPSKKAKAAPMTLALDGDERSFAELVRRYSGDMPVQSVLDELLRAGTVTRRADGSIQLVNRTYLAAKDEAGKVFLLVASAMTPVSVAVSLPENTPVIMEGLIKSVTLAGFTMHNRPIIISNATTFEQGNATDLREDARGHVIGRFKSGSFDATKVIVAGRVN